MITNLQLIDYAENQIGNPYWWGTFGQIATEALHASKVSQYPTTYNSSLYKDWKDQIGKRCHDCVGLIKGAIWSGGDPTAVPKYATNGCPDVSADGMHSNAKTKGSISSIPEVKGLYVWHKGHIGIYIGNGELIEAMGHASGVVKSKLKDRNFTHWGYIPYINYVEEEKKTEPETVVKTTTQKEDDDMDISKLTDEQCYEIIARANSYAAGLKPSQDWAKDAVQKAKDNGISDGSRPKSYATRMEVMGMINNALKK